jgi:hypothetical protein
MRGEEAGDDAGLVVLASVLVASLGSLMTVRWWWLRRRWRFSDLAEIMRNCCERSTSVVSLWRVWMETKTVKVKIEIKKMKNTRLSESGRRTQPLWKKQYC